MKINRAAFKAASEGDHVVADFDPESAQGGHSMVVAGYRTQPDGTYFLLHNSWGKRWGDGGYGWIHERQLGAVKMVRVVEAVRQGEPLVPGLTESSSPAPACPGAQVPDAATQACVAPCEDGAPPLAGECADEECDPGEVSLGGRCVAAAPTRQGTVNPSGVRFECKPGGCVYRLPAKSPGCEGAGGCAFSCAAPAFLLARSGAGVFCTE